MDAERLTGVFDASEDALPLKEVDKPGRTKPSVLGDEVDMDGAIRAGTTMGAGRSFSIMAMTFSTTSSWPSCFCFLLAISQNDSLSRFEASISSSWQHTGVVVLASESRGGSSEILGWFSWACLPLCLRTRQSTILRSFSELRAARKGSGLRLAREARWELRRLGEARPSQAVSRALLSAWEKGRRALEEDLSETEVETVAVERGSSNGIRLW